MSLCGGPERVYTRRMIRRVPRHLVWCGWCMLLACVVLSGMAWSAAPNNPRDGWSMAAIWTGRAPVPGSGDRAFLAAGYHGRPFAVDLTAHGMRADEHVEVVVRRTRQGLFVPWIETTDLRLVSYSGGPRHFRTGTPDPAWHGVLRAVREIYGPDGAGSDAVVLAGIDRELAGRHPRRRVLFGPALLEGVFVLAHAVALAGALFVVHRSVPRRVGPSVPPQVA